MNTNDYNILIDTIKQIAGSECQRIMKGSNVASNYFATVVGVNENKTYNVMLASGTTPYTNVVNKTGETIDTGDVVLIEALNGNIGNGYIKLKQGISDISGAPDTIAWGKVYNTPHTLGGYGITDAKIDNGTITLGTNSLAPITEDNIPVKSVNNKTGAVVLTASDVGALPTSTVVPTKVSQLDNDSGYITEAPVTSVNGDTGVVVLTASDVGAVPTSRKINGKVLTSDITLTAANVGALPDTTVIPTKTSELDNDSNFVSDENYIHTDNNFTTTLKDQIGTNTTNITNHIANTSNPHNVTKTQVGLSNVDNIKQYSASNPPPYPVTSVNSKTGAVSLTASDVDAVAKSGDTMTGSLTTPALLTGTAEANYFQSKKFRGEGNANTYYHAIDFGYSGHNQVDFHEYGGLWNFYQNTAGTSDGGTLVASIQSDGFHGDLTGTATIAKSVYPATTTTVGGIKVGSGLAIT